MVVLSMLRAVLSIAWGGLLSFDVAVFILTLYKATKLGYKTPLMQVLVRDGERIILIITSTNDRFHSKDPSTLCTT